MRNLKKVENQFCLAGMMMMSIENKFNLFLKKCLFLFNNKNYKNINIL